MAKVQNISTLQRTIPFTEFDFYHRYREAFEKSPLGRIHAVLPLHEMAVGFGLTDNRRKARRGRKPYMQHLDTVYTDATCYESRMRYPTDTKLVWECVEKSHALMCEACRRVGVRRYRTKYHDMAAARLVYVKKKRHAGDETRHILMRMLKLLKKILADIWELVRKYGNMLYDNDLGTLSTIIKAFRQQWNHFQSADRRESVRDRIVSISKPYVRPIVRGKEAKRVEFGAKCNNIMIDGISFIEKLSFNAYNEGSRLPHCIRLAEKLTGVKVCNVAADRGYSSNQNRRLCTDLGILTSFPKKGGAVTDDAETQALRRELARVRATSMEGSFGTQKEHYSLGKVIAQLKCTEILMIFFGIHTTNAVNIARRIPCEFKFAA